jgi:hypothetical protein
MALILAGPDHGSAYTAAAVVFAVAASTDFVDGYLARRWAVTTKLGSFLDTTADKLLVSGALIALVDVRRASAWIAAIIVGRELLILGLRGGRHRLPAVDLGQAEDERPVHRHLPGDRPVGRRHRPAAARRMGAAGRGRDHSRLCGRVHRPFFIGPQGGRQLALAAPSS